VVFYRRDLPHWHPDRASLFITWRLFGSLPANLPGITVDESPGEHFARLDKVMDRAAVGPTWLRDPRVAGCVVAALAHGAVTLRTFDLHAYVVMPNHVHVLLTTRVALRELTKAIKGVSARHANAILGRNGLHFWQVESYDHWVRSAVEYRRICRYIEKNPVTAGLVANAEDWRWSSANLEGKSIITPLLLAR
jgi:putative transposase